MRPIRQKKRDCESGGKRIGSAHSDPGDQSYLLPGCGVFSAKRFAEQTRQIGSAKEPGETNEHQQKEKQSQIGDLDRRPGASA